MPDPSIANGFPSSSGDPIAASDRPIRRRSRSGSGSTAAAPDHRRTDSELTVVDRLRAAHTLDSSDPLPVVGPAPPRVPSVLQRWREAEGEATARERSDITAEGTAGSREQSPELGEGERERVRRVVRGWMDERVASGSAVSTSSRGPEWLGEIERERVRLVREWVRTASQQGGREEGVRDADRIIINEGSIADREEGGSDLPRLRGRRAQLELIMRIVQGRGRELQDVAGLHVVSNFAHGDRIQSLLRDRFLHGGGPSQEERPLSTSETEVYQSGQQHRVSETRAESGVQVQESSHAELPVTSENVESHSSIIVDTPNGSQEESLSDNEENDSEPPVDTHVGWHDSVGQGQWHGENEISEQQEDSEIGFHDWPEGTVEGSDRNWQGNSERWHHEIEGGPDTEDWHENRSNMTTESWPDESSNPNINDHPSPLRRPFRFSLLDDDSVYSTELRELVGRRSVSNLLRSEFRESLDQLIQSYVQSQRRDYSPVGWDMQSRFQNPPAEQDQVRGGNVFNLNRQDFSGTLRPMFSSQVPASPIWRPEFRSWSRRSRHRSVIEGDVINDLRVEMARLQQGMGHMQRMLETCMDMQLELQRSIGEEVSAALGRSVGRRAEMKPFEEGSNWIQVQKGTCCICCDSHIDSLLYRCGHMCSCWRCATELIQSDGKCPLCRAPIVDVIRAYSVA